MSGIFTNRCKKKSNSRKNKPVENSEVLQVKSVKLEPKRMLPILKGSAKSEYSIWNNKNTDGIQKSASEYGQMDLVTVRRKDVPSTLEELKLTAPDTFTQHWWEGPCSSNFEYYPKKSTSIRFTTQANVFYYNGDSAVIESQEPLKKESDQHIRNKEMRKEHILKGQEKDNVYLY